ncbi:MAG: hypothetical protein IPI01_10375 [Ignavibacteriae bacterium]|nr:hypothetical protein [Ignavibacteriota bacterium]
MTSARSGFSPVRNSTSPALRGYGFALVRSDQGSYVGPKNGSTITESDIVFYVGGTNAQSSYTTSVNLGPAITLYANVYAPNGTLWLQSNTRATGAYVGKDVCLMGSVNITLGTAFTGLASPRRTDGRRAG